MAETTPLTPTLEGKVKIIIKNPTKESDHQTEVPSEWTVGELKGKLAREYEGNPAPNTQKLIYAGGLLKDSVNIRDVLKPQEIDSPHIFHMVVSSKDMGSSSRGSTPSASPQASRPGLSPNPFTPGTPQSGQLPGASPQQATQQPMSTAPLPLPPHNAMSPAPQPTTTSPTAQVAVASPDIPYSPSPAQQDVLDPATPTFAEGTTAAPPSPPGPYMLSPYMSPMIHSVYYAAFNAAYEALSPGSSPGTCPVPVPMPYMAGSPMAGVFAGPNIMPQYFAPPMTPPGVGMAPQQLTLGFSPMTGPPGAVPGAGMVTGLSGAGIVGMHAAQVAGGIGGSPIVGGGVQPHLGGVIPGMGPPDVTHAPPPGSGNVNPAAGVQPPANAADGLGVGGGFNFGRADADAAAAAAAAGVVGADLQNGRLLAPNPVPGQPPVVIARVRIIRIDLKLILKLAMAVFFLSQGASKFKLWCYIAGAVIIYLHQTGALAPLTRWFSGGNADGGVGGALRNPAGVAAGGAGEGGAAAFGRGGAGGPNASPPGPRTSAPFMRGMPTTWMGEVKVFVYGFMASLLPNWVPPELHRHRPAPPSGASAAAAVDVLGAADVQPGAAAAAAAATAAEARNAPPDAPPPTPPPVAAGGDGHPHQD